MRPQNLLTFLLFLLDWFNWQLYKTLQQTTQQLSPCDIPSSSHSQFRKCRFCFVSLDTWYMQPEEAFSGYWWDAWPHSLLNLWSAEKKGWQWQKANGEVGGEVGEGVLWVLRQSLLNNTINRACVQWEYNHWQHLQRPAPWGIESSAETGLRMKSHSFCSDRHIHAQGVGRGN